MIGAAGRSVGLVVWLVLAGYAQSAEPLDVILVAGQSNAVGYDARPDQLPADDADRQIRFWYRCGDPPPDEFDVTSARRWTTLGPQPRGTPNPDKKIPRQYGNFAQPQGGFGPEIGLGRALQKNGATKLAIIKVAFSGTNLSADWRVDDEGAHGPCLAALLSETKLALTAIEAEGFEPRLRAMAWVQGESDANARDAPLYAGRLQAMFTTIRRELKSPELAALIAVNTRFGGGKNALMPKIVEAQQEAASKLTRAVYVDTASATIANGAHYDSAGTLDVGRRFAEALVKLESTAARGSGPASP